jgi:hypothetical protein
MAAGCKAILVSTPPQRTVHSSPKASARNRHLLYHQTTYHDTKHAGGKITGLIISTLLSYTVGSVIVTDPQGAITAQMRRHSARLGRVMVLNPWRTELKNDPIFGLYLNCRQRYLARCATDMAYTLGAAKATGSSKTTILQAIEKVSANTTAHGEWEIPPADCTASISLVDNHGTGSGKVTWIDTPREILK